jgi:cytochrome c-type biogenesis protein
MTGFGVLLIALNGPGALGLAFAAGVISFLSPCTLPLLPGYLSYISGLGMEDIRSGHNAATLTRAAGLFILGFSLVFVSIGAGASYIGSEVGSHKILLTRLAGVFIIIMALVMLGLLRLPFMYREKRLQVSHELGMWGALPMGMAFAFGWVPCVGPVLASIYALAFAGETVQKGALLLFCYALGLGLPLFAAALFAARAFDSLSWFKRHFVAITRTGGAILLVMGVFLVMNQWTQLLAPAMRWYAQLNLPL